MNSPATGSKIVSFGHYQPSRVLTNDDLAQMVDTNDEWIQSRVGIKERRIADGETVADMAGLRRGEGPGRVRLDRRRHRLGRRGNLFAADRSPNTACRVAAKLGIAAPAAVRRQHRVLGLLVRPGARRPRDPGRRLAQRDRDRRRETVRDHRLVRPVHRGDLRRRRGRRGRGSGRRRRGAGVGPVVWGSDPSEAIVIEGWRPYIVQEGQRVFRWATTAVPGIALAACQKAGVEPTELGGFVPHQANLRIIEPLARKLGVNPDVVARDIIESGNTSAASIPLALSKMIERGEVKSGAPVLLVGFGGGLTYAGQVIRCP
jgi:3-oxoacyl-[acyl-carrier-protein] synthase-3